MCLLLTAEGCLFAMLFYTFAPEIYFSGIHGHNMPKNTGCLKLRISNDHYMIIAVDFDGTIVEHRYPDIGKEKMFAFETLRALQRKRHQLILWTFRVGKELDAAVEYCRENGVEFYAVNRSYPEEIFDETTMSRKIQADIFIDDRNIGGFPGWGEIWHMLNPDENPSFEEELKKLQGNRRSGSSWLKKLFS